VWARRFVPVFIPPATNTHIQAHTLHPPLVALAPPIACSPTSLRSAHASEAGGLSGAPLRDASTAVLGRLYDLTRGEVPLIGVGGVASGRDAYEKIRHGASLVQLYSALAYEGPGLVSDIKQELAQALREDGFARLSDAVGVDTAVGRARRQQQQQAPPSQQ